MLNTLDLPANFWFDYILFVRLSLLQVISKRNHFLMDEILINFNALSNTFTCGATVPTGFEQIAADEIREKLVLSKCFAGQGKVYFQTTVDCLSKIHHLRSVDRLFLVLKKYKNYTYNEDKEEAINDLKILAEDIPWDKVVEFWKENTKHQKLLSKSKLCQPAKKKKLSYVKIPGCSMEDKSCEILNIENSNHFIRFRATANRLGKQQSITSPDAEQHFGGAIQDCTQWKVDLTNYNLEILITLGVDFVLVCLSLTHASLHRRNIVDYGYTTLRASIAYNMLRMCDIQSGDIVIDPMCGSGSIPIEAAQEWSCCCHLAGDNSNVAVNKCLSNVAHVNKEKNSIDDAIKAPVDIFHWDVRKLPLKNGAVDVFVTDLPFGKRLGSKMNNRALYPSMLKEMARVCKPKTGRACLLTSDKRSITNAINEASKLWTLKRTNFVNIGGLRAAVYLLKRTIIV